MNRLKLIWHALRLLVPFKQRRPHVRDVEDALVVGLKLASGLGPGQEAQQRDMACQIAMRTLRVMAVIHGGAALPNEVMLRELEPLVELVK